MKTKEQILETALDSHHVSGLVEEGGRIWRAILEAMEEYRNQPSGEGVKRHVEIGIANEAYRVWCETEGKNPHTPADFNLFCAGFRKGYLNQYQPGEREGVKSAEKYLKEAYHKIIPGDYDMIPEEAAIAALAAQARDMEVKLFDPKKDYPIQNLNDFRYSVDVFIIDEEGMSGLAYFDFADREWRFHTDTLVDYNELDNKTEWRWYYPPVAGFRNDRSKPKE